MAIQKKSLISNRTATKKALVAKPEVANVVPTRVHGGFKPTRMEGFRPTRLEVRPARLESGIKPTRLHGGFKPTRLSVK
jgi:hypothetical protein